MKALNVKIALLTCVGFTVGMCWMVSQVSRPVASAAGATVALNRTAPAVATGARPADALRRGNPIDAARSAGRHQADAAITPATRVASDAVEGKLPPVSLPRFERERGVVTLASSTVEERAATEPSTASLPPNAIEVTRVPEALVDTGNTLTAQFNRETPESNLFQDRGIAEPAAAEADPAPAPHYIVKSGDNLARIARQTLGSDDSAAIRALIAANPKLKSRPNKVLLGEKLNIPPKEGGTPAVATVAPKPEKSPSNTPPKTATREKSTPRVARSAPETPKAPATARNQKPSKSAKTQWVMMRDKETGPAFAKRVLKDERRWREIQALNGLKPGAKTPAGTKLRVPVAKET